MKFEGAPRIMAVAAVCAAALIAVVVSEGIARESGQEILLPIEAVDPRALLSGHYVQIAPTQRLEPGEQCPSGAENEWVALRPTGANIYRLAGGAPSRETAQQVGPLPVKGSFSCSPPPAGDQAGFGWIALDLGIDRFHINQSDAMRIERVLRQQQPGAETRAYAIVSVGRDGRARLKGLIIDGERLELSWL